MNTPADIVLGAMYFGTKTDEKSSFDLLDRFVELGGRTIDTANCYAFWADPSGAGGRSEEVIGRWLRANPGLREELTIATKVGQEPAVAGEFSVVEGLSGDVIDRELNRSLERLGLDRVDVYWAHGEDRSADLAETVEAFGRTVADGRVSRLGISNHPTWRVEQARAIAQARDLEPFTVLQLTTSYLRPRPDVAVPGKDHRFGFVTDETTTSPSIRRWSCGRIRLWCKAVTTVMTARSRTRTSTREAPLDCRRSLTWPMNSGHPVARSCSPGCCRTVRPSARSPESPPRSNSSRRWLPHTSTWHHTWTG